MVQCLDFVQIYERGISLENIKTIGIFKNGASKMVLVEPAFCLKEF
jgi:hypothetical protein